MNRIENLVNETLISWVSEIKRVDMPQVKNKSVPDILELFDKYNISYTEGKLEVGKLLYTQEDYIPSKLNGMIDKMKSGDWEDNPIFISKDGYILDGHHRALAYKKHYGEDYSISVIRVDLPKEDALKVFSVGAEKVSESITEAKSKTIVVFPGRFSPFHQNHYDAYQHLVKKFGDVYIATSNKVEPNKSPFFSFHSFSGMDFFLDGSSIIPLLNLTCVCKNQVSL